MGDDPNRRGNSRRWITRAVEVPRSGHWLPEENPEFVTAELLAFFGGTTR